MISTRILLIIAVASFLFSCTGSSHRKLIAEVEDEKLYLDEISIPQGLHSKDSAGFVKTFAENWVSDMLMKNEAEATLGGLKSKIDSMTAEYRRKILIDFFEQKIITDAKIQVSDDEKNTYYQSHPEDFILPEPIMCGKYFIVDEKCTDAEKLALMLKNSKSSEKTEFESLAQKNNAEFEYNKSGWMYYSEVQLKFGLNIDSPEDYFVKNKEISGIFSGKRFLFIPTDIKNSGELTPFAKIKDLVGRIVKVEKEKEILRAYRNKLYENSLSNSQIKITL